MPFTLIKGTFRPDLGRPDGDSVRFVPDDPNPIMRLRQPGRPPKINQSNGSIQLRYEAIDTMESAALDPFSSDATASNLALIDADGGRGFILSRQLDPGGRPICFVYTGDPSVADGSDVFLSADGTPHASLPTLGLTETVNVKQLATGHAYPLFYDTLFDDLRAACTEVSNTAKSAGLNVWSADQTNSGTTWTGDENTLQPIFPKLWRRIDKYVRDDTFFDKDKPFANLKPWMEQQRDERVSIPSQGIFTGFDDIVETTDTTVKLKHEPHEMVVISL